jgi:cytochrome P450
MTEAQSPVDPAHGVASQPPSARDIARSLRDNAIGIFPPQAFDEEVVFRNVFGRRQIIMNRPAGIQHILVDNPGNYPRRCSAAALYPAAGAGCGCRRRCAAGTVVAGLKASCADPVDLLAAMQFLALEIAGASMFSLEMEPRYGAELRDLIQGYASHLGRPSLLDFLLPPSIPSLRDVFRWRFRRRWLNLVGRIIAARREQGSAGAPPDLFDLLSTARDPDSSALFPPDRLADQVATMIVAGDETTAVALFWSLYLLASAPAIQDRLAAEVAVADLGPDNAAAALPALMYTRAVVHEALRLYPPAFTLRAKRSAPMSLAVSRSRRAPWS